MQSVNSSEYIVSQKYRIGNKGCNKHKNAFKKSAGDKRSESFDL